MTFKQATWKWTEEHHKAFEHMMKSISRETLLVYPNFSKPFVIHIDASKVYLGAVISQNNKPIGFLEESSTLHRLITQLQKENYYPL